MELVKAGTMASIRSDRAHDLSHPPIRPSFDIAGPVPRNPTSAASRAIFRTACSIRFVFMARLLPGPLRPCPLERAGSVPVRGIGDLGGIVNGHGSEFLEDISGYRIPLGRLLRRGIAGPAQALNPFASRHHFKRIQEGPTVIGDRHRSGAAPQARRMTPPRQRPGTFTRSTGTPLCATTWPRPHQARIMHDVVQFPP